MRPAGAKPARPLERSSALEIAYMVAASVASSARTWLRRAAGQNAVEGLYREAFAYLSAAEDREERRERERFLREAGLPMMLTPFVGDEALMAPDLPELPAERPPIDGADDERPPVPIRRGSARGASPVVSAQMREFLIRQRQEREARAALAGQQG